MKKIILLVCCFVGVFLPDKSFANAEDANLIAGIFNSTVEKENIENDQFYPCSLPKYKPDFNAPSRRISEIKCYGYIWEIKNRINLKKRFGECEEHVKKNPDFTGPYLSLVGKDLQPAEFPHLASIGWQLKDESYIYLCLGTLISQNFVLTAAQCTRARSNNVTDRAPKVVRLGYHKGDNDNDKTSKTTIVNISQIIVHPSYKAPKGAYDIALVRMFLFVSLSSVMHPACLWTKTDLSALGTKAIITGFDDPTEPLSKVKSEEVDIIDKEKCDALLKPICNRQWCGVEDHQLCAGNLEKGIEFCRGSAGGPLQVKIDLPVKDQGEMSYIIGVTSLGYSKCPRPDSANIYTRVSSFIDWIEDNVWK